MAIPDEQWERIRELYEHGVSLDDIIKRKGITLKNKSSISRRAKADGWFRVEEKATLVNREVSARTALLAIESEKATKNATAVSVHNELVDERTRHIAYFNDASYQVTNKAIQLLNDKDDLTTADVRNISETVAKQREGVLGKAPDVAVQVNNSVEHPREIRIVAG